MFRKINGRSGHTTDNVVWFTMVIVLVMVAYMFFEENIDRILFSELKSENVVTISDKEVSYYRGNPRGYWLEIVEPIEDSIQVSKEEYSKYKVGDKICIEKINYKSRLTDNIVKVKNKIKS